MSQSLGAASLSCNCEADGRFFCLSLNAVHSHSYSPSYGSQLGLDWALGLLSIFQKHSRPAGLLFLKDGSDDCTLFPKAFHGSQWLTKYSPESSFWHPSPPSLGPTGLSSTVPYKSFFSFLARTINTRPAPTQYQTGFRMFQLQQPARRRVPALLQF